MVSGIKGIAGPPIALVKTVGELFDSDDEE